MLKSGAIYQFSFAYDVLGWEDPSKEQKEKGIFNVLTKLEVFEISVVTVPANQNAVMTEVKNAEPETKQGRRNRKSDEDIIRSCIESLQSLLDEDDGDNSTEDEAKAAEAEPKVNEASEEPKDDSNAKRAEAILSHIKSMKEVPDHDD
jgi:hypothetical protein